jgi:isoleucyl-tRNA synthetase
VIDDEGLQTVQAALAIKDVALKALENAREAKKIGASLDACVVLEVPDAAVRERLQRMNAAVNGVDQLKYLFVTSQVSLVEQMREVECSHVSEAQVEGLGAVKAGVRMADGRRCERCWHYCDSVGASVEHSQVCERCLPVVEALGFQLPAVPEKKKVAAA